MFSQKLFLIKILYYIVLFIYWGTNMSQQYVAVKAQLKGINSSFPLCWSQGLDSGPRFDLVYLYLLSRLTGPVITLKSLYIYIQIYVYTYIYKRVLFVLKHILPYFLGSVSTFIFFHVYTFNPYELFCLSGEQSNFIFFPKNP